MNQAATVVVAVIVAAAAAAGISFALRPEQTDGDGPAVAALQTSLRSLEAENRRLAGRLEELANRPAPATTPTPIERTAAPVVGAEQIAAAVEAYLQKRGSARDAAGGGATDGQAFDLEKDFDALVGTSFFSNSAAWKRAFDAGRMDEVIAQFEALAKADPKNVDAKMNLANAYLSYLQMDNSKWQLSMKADQQFDDVLALDQNHWRARFSKAVSYTFWPDFLGKKPEAIAHFETLMKQQESMPVEDSQAQTYLYLGNLLAERDPARAREIWQKGATRHPNSQELRQKLGQ